MIDQPLQYLDARRRTPEDQVDGLHHHLLHLLTAAIRHLNFFSRDLKWLASIIMGLSGYQGFESKRLIIRWPFCKWFFDLNRLSSMSKSCPGQSAQIKEPNIALMKLV